MENSVAVSGDYAYVTSSLAFLLVIRIADPASPTWVARMVLSDPAYGVAVGGGHAYVATSAGLLVVSIADPAGPGWVGFVNTPGKARGVAVSGNYAYVADDTAGLRVISVADPAHPTEVGYYRIEGSSTTGVTVIGDVAYVAYGSEGLQICQFYGYGIEEGPGAHVRPMGCVPAMARGVLMLPDVPGRTARVASLLDAGGRTVLDLRPGPNDVSDVAPGVYFVQTEPTAASRQPLAVAKVVICR